MLTIIIGVLCLALGLYAGKRRAAGAGWSKIVCDLAMASWRFVSRVYEVVSRPFRKGGADGAENPSDE